MAKKDLNEQESFESVETTEQNEIDETANYIDKFAKFEKTVKEKNLHLPVAYRIIMRSYINQGLIPEYEYDEILSDIEKQKDGKINQRVNEFFSSLLGLLFFPLLVKKIENITMQLNFQGDEELFQQAYKKKMFDSMLNKLD